MDLRTRTEIDLIKVVKDQVSIAFPLIQRVIHQPDKTLSFPNQV